jgi:2-polyprenyl-6-methoxyphenol hydroxylase-like FAD-dependent oxidoreductase
LLPSGLDQLTEDDLRALALQRIDAWHPTLRRMVAASDLGTMLLTPIRSAAPLEAWSTTNVTLLGDAIHSMPPTGGIGANTALRDAALLTTKLASVAGGERRLLPSIADYEAEMRDYGFAAVRSSLHDLQRQQRTENASKGML